MLYFACNSSGNGNTYKVTPVLTTAYDKGLPEQQIIDKSIAVLRKRFEFAGEEADIKQGRGNFIEITTPVGDSLINDYLIRGQAGFYKVVPFDSMEVMLSGADEQLREASPENGKKFFSEYLLWYEGTGRAPLCPVEKKDELLDLLNKSAEIPAIANHTWFLGGGIIKYEGYVDALPLYCLEKKPAITGDVIVDAAFEPDEMGNRNIMLTFNDEGKEQFSTLTAGSIGKKIAITVDSMVYTAPVVQAEITEGRAIITGHEDLNKTKILAYIIKAGPLPCLFTVEKITE